MQERPSAISAYVRGSGTVVCGGGVVGGGTTGGAGGTYGRGPGCGVGGMIGWQCAHPFARIMVPTCSSVMPGGTVFEIKHGNTKYGPDQRKNEKR